MNLKRQTFSAISSLYFDKKLKMCMSDLPVFVHKGIFTEFCFTNNNFLRTFNTLFISWILSKPNFNFSCILHLSKLSLICLLSCFLFHLFLFLIELFSFLFFDIIQYFSFCFFGVWEMMENSRLHYIYISVLFIIK